MTRSSPVTDRSTAKGQALCTRTAHEWSFGAQDEKVPLNVSCHCGCGKMETPYISCAGPRGNDSGRTFIDHGDSAGESLSQSIPCPRRPSFLCNCPGDLMTRWNCSFCLLRQIACSAWLFSMKLTQGAGCCSLEVGLAWLLCWSSSVALFETRSSWGYLPSLLQRAK